MAVRSIRPLSVAPRRSDRAGVGREGLSVPGVVGAEQGNATSHRHGRGLMGGLVRSRGPRRRDEEAGGSEGDEQPARQTPKVAGNLGTEELLCRIVHPVVHGSETSIWVAANPRANAAEILDHKRYYTERQLRTLHIRAGFAENAISYRSFEFRMNQLVVAVKG